jgi:ankyrin repeat protein
MGHNLAQKYQVVKRLVENGANINKTNKAGWTALMLSSFKGHLSIVNELILRGADVNIVNRAGCSSLMYSSLNGHLPIVKALIESMTDVKQAINDNQKSLLWASSMGHQDVVKTLVDFGADEKCVAAALLELVSMINNLKATYQDVAHVLSKKYELFHGASFHPTMPIQ